MGRARLEISRVNLTCSCRVSLGFLSIHPKRASAHPELLVEIVPEEPLLHFESSPKRPCPVL